ncbi:MAG: HDOD domain-containing protein [Candidatus Cloacimonetes bacterium]|nr:HDOD domain-containing protein [Candidatus Cloacimonadota bacterium]
MKDLIDIEKDMNEIANLPTISIIASKLLDMLVNDNIAMGNISELMQHDPAITAKVLKIVNSAYYGLRKEIDTLKMALVLLGINEITNIVMSLSLFRGFSLDDKSVSEFNREAFWEHSSITAYFSQFLGKRMGMKLHGEEFTAGLIHDIGKIILDQYYSEDFSNIVNLSTEHNIRSVEAEKAIIGITHADIGAIIARKWKLPEKLAVVIKYHHNIQKAESDIDLSALICIADILAHVVGDYQREIYENINIEESEAWLVLGEKASNIDLESLKEELIPIAEKAKSFIHETLK